MATVRRVRSPERVARRLVRMLIALTLVGIAFGTAGWRLQHTVDPTGAVTAPVVARTVVTGPALAVSTRAGTDAGVDDGPVAAADTTVDAPPTHPVPAVASLAGTGTRRAGESARPSGDRAVPAAGAPRAPPTHFV